MKKSIKLIILIFLITVFFILVYLGWQILNSASKSSDVNEVDSKNTYSYNNVNFTYGNEWQEGYYMLGNQKVKAILNKDESISIFGFGKEDNYMYDYSNSIDRQGVYNEKTDYLEDVCSSYGITMESLSNGFKNLNDNLYYAFWEISSNYYSRTYMVLNSKENTNSIIFVISNESLTKTEENRVIEILKTVHSDGTDDNVDNNSDDFYEKKPIIYIYPKEQTKVSIKVGKPENLSHTYPKYENGWEVIAKPNGDLIDTKTGRNLYALYWEGKNTVEPNMNEGFIVKGKDTITFLEEKLKILGLNEREANEFIIYWLPKLESNKYNFIRFQTEEEINNNMPLEIEPKPDTVIRVVMEFKALEEPIQIQEQNLKTPERTGYTVVEWGGTEIKVK